MAAPLQISTELIFPLGELCIPKTSSQGNWLNKPSSSIPLAPPKPSSAGWNIKTAVPSNSRVSAKCFAAPSNIVVCPS